ncbi:MAG: hypothetical protein ACOX2O_06270 [Bdellovibrionota bacterium]|jgi:hypothetical protein
MCKLIRKFVIGSFLPIFLCTACSSKDVTPAVESLNELEDGAALAPFKLSVLDEVFDGKEVFLRIKLDVFAPWDASMVAFKLTTLKDGAEYGVKSFLLEDLLGREVLDNGLVPPKEYTLVLNAPSKSATDYQLEMVWKVEVSEERQPLKLINVVSTKKKECHDGNKGKCSEIIEVALDLKNEGQTQLKNIVLSISFIASEGGVDVVKYTQDIPIEGLVLEPDQRQAVRFEVEESEDPELRGLDPIIQIVSYQ